MSTSVIQQQQQQTPAPVNKSIKDLFGQINVKKRFEEMLGTKAQGFITSVLQCVASSDLLAKADPNSVLQAAAVAATLDLPLNKSLGFAAIIPFNTKISGKNGMPDTWKVEAQFQIMKNGFNQLALRSGQFKTINQTDVRQGEIVRRDRLTGIIEFKWVDDDEVRKGLPIIGYVAYFELLNGFSKQWYYSNTEVTDHGKKYSQSFKKNYGLWVDNFDAMALKTVTKLLLSKHAPLSIEMQLAARVDQAVIKDAETEDIDYVDNEAYEIGPADIERTALLINDAESVKELKSLSAGLAPELVDLFNEKMVVLKKAEQKAGKQNKIDLP